jgi:hypothetical protein
MLNFPLTLALSRRGREDWVAFQIATEVQSPNPMLLRKDFAIPVRRSSFP